MGNSFSKAVRHFLLYLKKTWLKIAIAMGSQSAHSNNRRESNYTELSLTIWLTGYTQL